MKTGMARVIGYLQIMLKKVILKGAVGDVNRVLSMIFAGTVSLSAVKTVS